MNSILRAYVAALLTWTFALSTSSAATPTTVPVAKSLVLPAVFADHMVVQADMPVPVWGTAGASEVVTVEFAGQTKSTTAGTDGAWLLKLDPLGVSAEPRALTVSARGGAARTIADVLVGEVWLCSGQSNMFRPLGRIERLANRFPGVDGAEEEIKKPADPLLRLYCDADNEVWDAAGWQEANDKSRRPFSAVAYFFGIVLRRELNVPVGLIHVSRGGSPIQAWTPEEIALTVPIIKKYHDIQIASRKTIADYGKARLAGTTRPTLSPEVETARMFGGFHLYDNLIEPLAPYGMRGVLWYQGESNASRLEVSQRYDVMLRALIDGWRDRWKQEQLPFYFVQLPCWDRGEYWPWTRQGQLNVSRTADDVGMVTITDFGDVTNLHPPQKREVGARLANLALARTYGKDRPAVGPVVKSLAADGGKLVLTFDTGGGVLTLKGDKWDDLEVAGADGAFVPATGQMTGDGATVWSAKVSTPTAVRYGWRAVFTPTLFNAAGLPASPFYYNVTPEGPKPPSPTVDKPTGHLPGN